MIKQHNPRSIHEVMEDLFHERVGRGMKHVDAFERATEAFEQAHNIRVPFGWEAFRQRIRNRKKQMVNSTTTNPL